MDYKINFHEPIPQVVERLKQEHDNFELNLKNIEKHVDKNEIKRAIEIIHNISESIIKHAVEEEGRIMRIILEKAKEVSSESIRIIQEHKWVVDFLRQRLQNIESMIHQKDEHKQQQQQQHHQQKVKNEINEFVTNLRNHFYEEEQIVFPLALKVHSS